MNKNQNKEPRWKEVCESCGKTHIMTVKLCPSCGVHSTVQIASNKVEATHTYIDTDCDGCVAYRDHTNVF